VKPPADQYSTAATLYHLPTGQQIFDLPRDSLSRSRIITKETPIPILSRNPKLPEGLAAAIHKALNREPKDRHSTMTAFRDELLPFANWSEGKPAAPA